MKRIHIVLFIVVALSIALAVMVSISPKASITEQFAALFLGTIGGIAAFAEIVGLLDRVGIPDKVQSVESKFIELQKTPFETNVAIWGPKGSGKSWLIKAFGQTLYKKYKNKNLRLGYRLSKIDKSFFAEIHQGPDPTAFPDVLNFIFERQKRSSSFDEAISIFKHDIRVFDGKGVDLWSLREDVSSYTLMNLAGADIIIVVLDPTIVEGSAVIGGLGLAQYSRIEYAQKVQKLFSVLEKSNPNKQFFYAVCITKADLIPGSRYLHPDALIEAFFGPEMLDVVDTIGSERAQTFTTSSFGYLPGTDKPNAQMNEYERIEIKDVKNWKPYGVEYPFFWAFESKERKLLEEILRKSFWGKMMRKNVLRNYVSYPKAKYEN